ncbi:MAG TPA: hypothetical protein VNN10_08635 [Dehalococcoidia bacterium]|nr:hypothetical protein [Dehalococcoidia bacterium]
MDNAPATPLRANPLRKLLVLAPPLLSGGAAALLLAMAPAAWGAADDLGLASWVPTVSALFLALPALSISLYALRALWRRMTGLFEVDLFGAAVGAASHWVAAVCLVTFAGTMGAEESYRSLGAGGTSSGGFVFLVVIATLIGTTLHGGLTMVYVWAVTPGRRSRLAERREDEVDFVEQWTRRRRR